MAAMRLEVWSDLICPWCGLGEHRLSLALARFAGRADVQVLRRSFQLDPRAPADRTQSVREMLRHKGLGDGDIDAVTSRVQTLASNEGLQPYRVLDNRVGNTSLAHELAAWATEQDRGADTWHALFKAYFGEARSIFDVASLVAIAGELGLDVGSARDALESRRYQERVAADGREATALGARGVPFFLFDRRYAVGGAQSVEVLTSALERAALG